MATEIRSGLLAVMIVLQATPILFSQEKGKSGAQEQPGLKVGRSAQDSR